MVDGYGAYQSLKKATRAGPGAPMTWAYCWAHVRRKLLEAEDMYPELSKTAVSLIKELYKIEREVPSIAPGMPAEEREQRLDLRRKLRHEKSRPKVMALRDWALEHRGSVLPRSKMGKAIEYMLNLSEGLTVFLDDPRVYLRQAAIRAINTPGTVTLPLTRISHNLPAVAADLLASTTFLAAAAPRDTRSTRRVVGPSDRVAARRQRGLRRASSTPMPTPAPAGPRICRSDRPAGGARGP